MPGRMPAPAFVPAMAETTPGGPSGICRLFGESVGFAGFEALASVLRALQVEDAGAIWAAAVQSSRSVHFWVFRGWATLARRALTPEWTIF